MKKIVLDDFMIVYNALEGKKAKLPVKILRRFKQELYHFTITNVPTTNLRVASIEDERVTDEELVLAIGKYNDLGLRGLHGIEADKWYRNIITEDIDFVADGLLAYAFPKLIKQNSGRLPLNKYLSQAKSDSPECRDAAKKHHKKTLGKTGIPLKLLCNYWAAIASGKYFWFTSINELMIRLPFSDT